MQYREKIFRGVASAIDTQSNCSKTNPGGADLGIRQNDANIVLDINSKIFSYFA